MTLENSLTAVVPGLNAALKNGVMHLQLDNPASRNALGLPVVEALISTLEQIQTNDVHCLVITANGPAFCAGLDLKDLDKRSDGDLLHLLLRIEIMLQKVYYAPCKTIAMAEGAAYGAGADLVAACRVRIGTPTLKMAFPGIKFGVFLGTRRLVSRIGSAEAERVLTGAGILRGEEAATIGLLTDLSEPSGWPDILDQHLATAQQLDPYISRHMGAMISRDHSSEDLADLVRSASKPNLKDRIKAYVDSMSKAKG
jgi:enoyl-CoA hydratase/carnithine racemase